MASHRIHVLGAIDFRPTNLLLLLLQKRMWPTHIVESPETGAVQYSRCHGTTATCVLNTVDYSDLPEYSARSRQRLYHASLAGSPIDLIHRLVLWEVIDHLLKRRWCATPLVVGAVALCRTCLSVFFHKLTG